MINLDTYLRIVQYYIETEKAYDMDYAEKYCLINQIHNDVKTNKDINDIAKEINESERFVNFVVDLINKYPDLSDEELTNKLFT